MVPSPPRADVAMPSRAPARARRVLLACALAGVVAEALFRGARIGVNFTVLVATFAGVHAAFTTEHAPLARRVAAASIPVFASVPVFLYDSQWSRFFAVPMALSWLLLVPRLVERGASLAIFGRVPERVAEAIVRLAPAFGRSLWLPVDSLRQTSDDDSRGRTALWAGLLGIPSVVVFVALFSFDDRFSSTLAAGLRRGDDALSFAVSAAGFALLVAVLLGLEELRPREIGPERGDLRDAPYRVPPRTESSATTDGAHAAFRPPPTAFALVLGQVALVFTLYVALHLRDLFTTHAFVRTTRGVTYAGQVHSGFFAVLVASGLALGLVLVGHALYAKTRGTLTVTESRRLRAAELALLALTLPALASCGQKLALYIDAYGETYLRLGVGLAIVTVLPLVVLAAMKSLRPEWPRFGAAAAAVLLASATGASFFDADAHLARVNIERALRGAPFDDAYVARLGPRALAGLASATRRGAEEEARFRVFAKPIVVSQVLAEAPPSVRGYRRTLRCRDVFGADLCAVPPPGAPGADLAPTRTGVRGDTTDE